ncbi:MAG: MotA/TolQ/ExbB proton channel family protein, partial [Nitrospirae bacterium]|nr:MotA/TolQ/ExbB proton channel family protein [Nitrospirota bacterium]
MNIILGAVITISLGAFALTVFRDIGISMIFNLDAFLIVLGGTTLALFVGFPFVRVRNTVNDIINAYSGRRDRDSVIKDILDISRTYMKTNIRNLESKIKGIDDDFLRLGAKLLINNYGGRDIKNIMEREMAIRLVDRNFSQNLLKTVARLTPSFGLAGTVISLIKMFKHMESVDTIAPMMAVALMSTFYGVIISNLI